MKLPGWYKGLLFGWAIVVVPFWWFAAAFNGEPFFSLPHWASSAEGAGWQSSLVIQIIICLAMASPLLALPIASKAARRGRKFNNAQD